MGLILEYHDTEFEIDGLRFPMFQSHHLQQCCQKALGLREQLSEAQKEQEKWTQWSKQEHWDSKDNPADVLKSLEQLLPHHWSTLNRLQTEAEKLIKIVKVGLGFKTIFDVASRKAAQLKNEISRLYSDKVFTRIEPKNLSDLDLSKLYKDLDKGGHVDPIAVYTPYVNEADHEVSCRAEQALKLKDKLSQYGVHLRWPSPPFNVQFDNQLEDERAFQVGWSRKLLELSGELSQKERAEIPFPLSPFSESSVAEYVGAHKKIVSERNLWEKMGWGQGLSEGEDARLAKLTELMSLTWRELLSGPLSQKRKALAEKKEFDDLLNSITVEVSKGQFVMGAVRLDSAAFDREKPSHDVIISHDMAVMKYLVTQNLYSKITGENPSKRKGDDLPVEKTSWYDAVSFANELSLKCGLEPAYQINGQNVTCDWNKNGWRLPTEAEWEYLAKGGTDHIYAGSDDADEVAWHGHRYWSTTEKKWTGTEGGNSGKTTHPVGQKKPNGFGLYDMSGNVFEWCWDWWKREYDTFVYTDPTGPDTGDKKVYRGGSWYIHHSYSRVTARVKRSPSATNTDHGFRLVRKK